jgi:hypothetical protein
VSIELKFKGELWYWRGPAPFHFIKIPAAQSAKIKAISNGASYGWGAIPVIAQIGKTEFTTSIFPKDGLYLLPIKNAVRIPEKIEIDDVINVYMVIK